MMIFCLGVLVGGFVFFKIMCQWQFNVHLLGLHCAGLWNLAFFHDACLYPTLTHIIHFCQCMIFLTSFLSLLSSHLLSSPLFTSPLLFFFLLPFFPLFSSPLLSFPLPFSLLICSQVLLALLTCQTPETCSWVCSPLMGTRTKGVRLGPTYNPR